ncbi:MAG: ComEC/Rec2 family competence protein [Steroidobacteraceae bacterium]
MPAIEIDFLAVGDESRSGDAIALRYQKVGGRHEVIVFDGGTKDSGAKLVELVRGTYGTNFVDHVVNSHPDGDHASGLSVVVEELQVGRLWMHRPWEHAEHIRHLFHDGRITDESLERRIREALQAAHDLEQLALRRRIPIAEPYQGQKVGEFVVLSPQREWYLQELVPNFRGTPEPKRAADSVAAQLLKAFGEARIWVKETLNIETLGSEAETSAQNESSVVMLGQFGDKKFLLTGDAGVQALGRAHAFAAHYRIRLNDLWAMQAPHHGSRSNVTPAILNAIKAQYVIASAAKKDDVHPHRVATNAFRRRGAKVYATNGSDLRQHFGMGERYGYGSAEEISFYTEVEG